MDKNMYDYTISALVRSVPFAICVSVVVVIWMQFVFTDEFLIYTREPAIPVELERKLVGIVSKHYNLSLLFKPRQTECKTRESNKVDEEAL